MKELLLNRGIEFSDSLEDLLCYGYDASRIQRKPLLIAWPRSTEDVIHILKAAYAHEIPVIPRGAGTATTGAASAVSGGIILSFEKMNQLLDVDSENLSVLVEPGLVNGQLQRELHVIDLFYPPDPASLEFCTIGGNVALNSGGPRALKYGVTRDYVMEIEAVTADGTLIYAGTKTVKATVGYDLKDLFIGSEGTLVVFTRIRLKVLPLPETILTMLLLFDSLYKCGEFVLNVLNNGIRPCCMELLDRNTLQVIEEYRPTGLPTTEAMLIVELDGRQSSVKEEAEAIASICRQMGGQLQIAEDSISRQRIWSARRAVAPALHRLAPDKISHDIVVPINRMPGILDYIKRVAETNDTKAIAFGHAGDGNIHLNVLYDRSSEQQRQRATLVVESIIKEVIKTGGTISGEHGIGITKAKYMNLALGQRELDLMRGIKKLFDHKNILNPGKVFQ